ncbi:hypothetical protein AOLI_G00316460 [Acnodon oligacanthus]
MPPFTYRESERTTDGCVRGSDTGYRAESIAEAKHDANPTNEERALSLGSSTLLPSPPLPSRGEPQPGTKEACGGLPAELYTECAASWVALAAGYQLNLRGVKRRFEEPCTRSATPPAPVRREPREQS